jgi:hypothetical protein
VKWENPTFSTYIKEVSCINQNVVGILVGASN